MATSKKDRDKLSPIYELMDNGELLTTEQFEELKRLTKDLTEDAKAMVEDYAKNPSQYSGSIDIEKGLVKGDGVVVHEDSPLLNDDDIIEQEDDGEI